jgi:hypothetical protein
MFVNNATASVASDSTTSSASTRSGISFDQKDGVQHHEGLHGVGPVQPRQGEHPRRRQPHHGRGYLDVDVEQQQKIGHLLSRCRLKCGTTPPFMERPTPTPPIRRSVRPNRSLRLGQRFPERVLEPAAQRRSSRSRCGRWTRTWGRIAGARRLLWPRNTRGGTIVVGALNLGGSIEMLPNAVRIAELAIDKQAQTL